MAKKSQKTYACQECGSIQQKWQGQCPDCGAWNSLHEESASHASPIPKGLKEPRRGSVINLSSLQTSDTPLPPRLDTQFAEFNRVCGGGIVPGSVFLIGGDPGIGKSTLLLQIAANLARSGQACAYITGEESLDQVRLRAQRLGAETAPVRLGSATNLRDILTTLERGNDNNQPFQMAIIDSIQTMYIDSIDSAPGTVSQVRACSAELIRVAKANRMALFLVGHVTKDGQIAGPRVMEHMVDTVLYFEGDRGHPFRIIRSVKNRFGATNEIGVFDMTDRGLAEVTNPSALFLSGTDTHVAGSTVFAGIEGSRPLLVEIQALVAPTAYGTPRRAVVGWDPQRLAMILAVLETRAGLSFGMKDVFLNIAGGLKISEPAADAAVAAALVSALRDTPTPRETVVIGEIALSGIIRPVSQLSTRLKEAEKLGFSRAIVPPKSKSTSEKTSSGMAQETITNIRDLATSILG